MIAKSLIAAAALAASITAFAPAQQAQAGVDINVNLGFGGYYRGYGYGYYPVNYRYYGPISCHKGKNIVAWSGFYNVRAVDCALPGYKYTAWRGQHEYLVKVNGGGNITRVEVIY